MNEVISNSTVQSSVPAFILMLQYLLHQQQNISDNKCKKYVDEISRLHKERQEFEKEKDRLEDMFAILHKKYVALQMKLEAVELDDKVGKLQDYPQNTCVCNCTRIEEFSNSKLIQTNSSDSNSLEKLKKFFETFFKKETADCRKDAFCKNSVCTKDRALLVASRMDHASVTEALVNAGSNVNAEDPMGWERTPLHWAAVLNHIEIARILLSKGANVESRETGVYSMYTPLHEAAKYGHLKMCTLLLDAHADTASKDRDGSTPLHTAARNGHLEVVKLLVDRGSVVTAQDKWGQTPRDRARKYRHHEVADWLSRVERLSTRKAYKNTR